MTEFASKGTLLIAMSVYSPTLLIVPVKKKITIVKEMVIIVIDYNSLRTLCEKLLKSVKD